MGGLWLIAALLAQAPEPAPLPTLQQARAEKAAAAQSSREPRHA